MQTLFFIYKTTNLINNKTYIGIHKTKKLNDGYLGSGLSLLRAIKKYGKEHFKREIIEFCSSYDELLDKEKIYVNEMWVLDDTNYNIKTGGQQNGFLSEESKNKISRTLKEKYSKGEIKPRIGPPYVANEDQKKQISETLKRKYADGTIISKTKGKEPWNKNKHGVQIAWNKGKQIEKLSNETKAKISKTLKEKHAKGEIKTRKNSIPWNKNKKGVQVSWSKGMKLPKSECPYCYKLVDTGNGKRWHFNNCKLKP